MARATPLNPTWIAAIHASPHDFAPLGTAVVIDERRVLTCAHNVVVDDGGIRPGLWVAFPMSEDPASPPTHECGATGRASDVRPCRGGAGWSDPGRGGDRVTAVPETSRSDRSKVVGLRVHP